MSDILLFWLALLLIYICWLCIPYKKSVPKWPLLGILPSLLWNLSRNHVHEFATRMIRRNGRTFHVRGSIFASLNWVVTCDPLNVRHILCRNFSNYPKGQKLKKITEALGDVLINSDGESWKLKREIVDSLLTSAKFQNLYTKTLHQKLGTTLIPILEQASCSSDINKQQQPLDLQDLMKRFTFDVICLVILGFDPESCCRLYSTAEYTPPRVAFGDAFDLVMEVIMHRYCIPECVWKLQRWFGIGMEREFGPAVECVDAFLEEKIRGKLMERFDGGGCGDDDFLRDVVLETERGFGKDGGKCAKEILFTLMLGGRDTVAAGLSWFFWLVATNPDVEGKILEEMDRVVTQSGEKQSNYPTTEELKRMVYLQGAINETMRLYPPVPFNHKQSLQPDVLPSGHAIDEKTNVVICIYSMGRMEEIWGDDCLEFKPERWVLHRDADDGDDHKKKKKKESIVHVPSYKLTAFLAGPRVCPGKQIAFAEMKTVAYSVLSRFKIEVVEGCGGKDVVPLASIVMFMKFGLKVRVSRRMAFL